MVLKLVCLAGCFLLPTAARADDAGEHSASKTEYRSVPLIATGAAVGGLGAAAAVAGGIWAIALNPPQFCILRNCGRGSYDSTGPAVLGVSGLGGLVAGAVLVVIGAQLVPVAAKSVALVPSVTSNGGGASLAVSF